ncbi:MAG TPA: hypothetical protein VKB67_04995 [Rhizomicrobium sp.]|nr:hypothetical protein [Rhizomicrobium sp.]
MHAHGDDFVIVDARGGENPLTPGIAVLLGDRNRCAFLSAMAEV